MCEKPSDCSRNCQIVLAARHRLRQGKEPVAPDKHRTLTENLLWMLRRREPSERAVQAMEMSLVLYAEHEFNASTFTARVVASTLADLHSAITAAIGALKGALHGGANERVMDVLKEVGTSANAEVWVRDALGKKMRIMGFGHRVYKDGDPRATILKPLCAPELAVETGKTDMEAMSDVIERIVGEEKKLPPNLDWPSARFVSLSRAAGGTVHAAVRREPGHGMVGPCDRATHHHRLIRPLSRYIRPGRMR